MIQALSPPKAPSEDKRWKIVEATMRRNNFHADALIESLHSVQQAFGFLDKPSMRWVSAALHVPLSKVYGVATFYQPDSPQWPRPVPASRTDT